MSDTVNDNPVTCPSCEYRYPRSKGTCVMCGTPTPEVEPLQLSSTIPDEFCPIADEGLLGVQNQRLSKLELTTLVAVLTVSMGLALFPSFRYELSKTRQQIELHPAPEVASNPGQPKSVNNGAQVVHYSRRQAPLAVPASLITVNKARGTDDVDPLRLWGAVKRGSVHAEVVLAKLYLRGESVPQNCEQAHMLLLAASMKGSKAAGDLLKSSYAESCQ